MPFRLVHYSETPLVFDATREYLQTEHFKPVGLWLSVEGNDEESEESAYGWKAWCGDNDFRPEWLAYETEFDVLPGATVLRIDSAGALLAFTHRYGRKGRSHYDSAIDWSAVASAYNGIIIAPYIWECRLSQETFWYYSWDCASGCFWNLRALVVKEVMDAGLKAPE